jgi:hypothetical protein
MQLGNYTDITNFIDNVLAKYDNPFMAILTDAVDALKDQLKAKCERVYSIREEKKEHVAAYLRYVALDKELKDNSREIEELAGIMGANLVVDTQNENSTSPIMDAVEDRASMDDTSNSFRFRSELPLWKAIKWYVGYAGEARINDVLLFLNALEFAGANRNAVESALRVHPDDFNVRKLKNEKFISLKGA